MAKSKKASSPASTPRRAKPGTKKQRNRKASTGSDELFDGKTLAEAEVERLRASGNTTPQGGASSQNSISAHERRGLIVDAAYRYYQQRQRDGAQGSQLDDWLKAELEIDRMIELRTHMNDH